MAPCVGLLAALGLALLGAQAAWAGPTAVAGQQAEVAGCWEPMLRWADLDHDGRIDRMELAELRLLAMDGIVESHWRAARERRDAVGTGPTHLFATAFTPRLQAIRRQRIAGRADSEALFLRHDLNGDDRLDARELQAMCRELVRLRR